MATKLDNSELQRKEREWQDDGKWRPLVLLSHLNKQASAEAFGSGADKTSGVQSAASSGGCRYCVVSDGVVIAISDGCTSRCKLPKIKAPTPFPCRTVIGTKQKRRENRRQNYAIKKRVERRDSVLSSPSGDKLDAIIQKAEPPVTENRNNNRFSVLDQGEEDQCTKRKKLHGQAVALVSFFNLELGLSGDIGNIPETVICGGLRSAVRMCYDEKLSVLQELSIKTSQKVEKSCCDNCEPRFDVKRIEWMRKMKKEVDVDEDHLARYRKLFSGNVPQGWNKKKYPYVPNGHATREHSRTTGGNWHREEFDESCHHTLVFSSGKPRVVTCYSSYNSQVLYPLHRSLYHYLQRRSWLLVGDPTNEHVSGLNGTGDYLSFDYVGATDNIKAEYVRAGIEILIEKSDGMSDDEKRCLRVLGNLKLNSRDKRQDEYDISTYWDSNEDEFDRHRSDFPRGQPMGSFMSFPLLCLTNKTIVDLSLTDLLEEGSITFSQWTAHRSLINGDDLLLREPDKKTNLRDRIIYNGGQVGMETNKEKCLQSQALAEVNSTLFTHEKKEKKTNAKSLYPEKMTEDYLGMALESTTTIRGFVRVCRANASLIAKQKDKFLYKLPYPYQAACRKDRKIRKALFKRPLDSYDEVDNFFGVTEKPVGYDLTMCEERNIIEERVNQIRDGVVFKRSLETDDFFARKDLKMKPKQKREDKKIRVVKIERSWRSLIRRPKRNDKEYVLSCLAEAFEAERRWLLGEDAVGYCSVDLITKGEHPSMIAALESHVKKPKTTLVSTSPVRLPNFSLAQHQEIIRRIEGRYITQSQMKFGRRKRMDT